LTKEELQKELIATIVKESSDSIQKNGNTKDEATAEFVAVKLDDELDRWAWKGIYYDLISKTDTPLN